MTDVLEATTTIHAPREEVFELLRDVEGYVRYSDHVEEVTRDGDGGGGTEYGIVLAWWRLDYTARFRVTDVDPPERVGWRVVEDLDARGSWRLEPTEVEDPTVEHATRATLTARYEPDSADEGALSLPPLVPVSAVVERARPFVEREAQRVLARVVADLEGEPRPAELEIRLRSDAGEGSPTPD